MASSYATWELWKLMIDAVGVRPLARANGVTEATIYRYARPPMHEDPDGTGTPNRFDALEATVEVLAFREAGRPVLRILRLYIEALFAQGLDRVHPRPISVVGLRAELPRLLREFADVVEAVGAEDACAQRITREWAEVVECGERLVAQLQAGILAE